MNKPALGLVVVAIAGASGESRAEWRSARGDVARTANVSAPGNLDSPVAYFRGYLGGFASQDGLGTGDLDGDGVGDIVMVSGGRVIAKQVTDALLWTSSLSGVLRLRAIVDLNGDSELEVIVSQLGRSAVLEGSSGKVLWLQPEGEVGESGAELIADINGDGYLDLFVEESTCGFFSTANDGFAYSFSPDPANPTLLWKGLDRPHCGSGATLLVDGNGNAEPEVWVGASESPGGRYQVHSGYTGGLLAQSAKLDFDAANTACLEVELDGTPAAEVVCQVPVDGYRGIYAFDLNLGAGTIDYLWQWNDVVQTGAESVFLLGESAMDLDGDGVAELVAGARDAQGERVTVVLDADGQEVERIPGVFVGTVPAGVDAQPIVFTRGSGSNALSTWVLSDGGAVGLASLEGAELVRARGAVSRRNAAHKTLPPSLDVNGDGIADVQLVYSEPAHIATLSGASGALVEIAKFEFPVGILAAGFWAEPPVDRDYPQLLVSRSDGYLNPLDSHLQPTNIAPVGGAPGVRLGGVSRSGAPGSSVLASGFGSGAETIVVTRGGALLQRLDAATASFSSPPKVLWELSGAGQTSIFVDGSAEAMFALRSQRVDGETQTSVVRLGADGTVAWEAPWGSVLSDTVPGLFDGDTTPDVAFVVRDEASSNQRVVALSGLDGETLWMAPVAQHTGQSLAIADWNDDGVDDVVFVSGVTHVYNGQDGTVLAEGTEELTNALPTVANFTDADGSEVLIGGNANVVKVLEHDLDTEVWASETGSASLGAALACPGTGPAVLIAVGAEGELRRIDTTSQPGGESAVVLAGGALYADIDAAVAAGRTLSPLGHVTVAVGLMGGSDPIALVGSSAGWLYGVDPCDWTLRFSRPFGAAVGGPIVADLDGDGLHEIVVTAGDGFIYGLRNAAIAAPEFVLDLDPAGPAGVDVDKIISTDALRATWSPVEGASGYDVAVIAGEGNYVTPGPWIDAGLSTNISVVDLPLASGGLYQVVVRARTFDGQFSPEALSDGVIVTVPGTGEGGGGAGGGDVNAGGGGSAPAEEPYQVPEAGCSCKVVSSGDSRTAWAGLLALLLIARRQRR